jgi:hypothetical protein
VACFQTREVAMGGTDRVIVNLTSVVRPPACRESLLSVIAES